MTIKVKFTARKWKASPHSEVVTIPKGIAELLDPKKEYFFTIEEKKEVNNNAKNKLRTRI